MAIGSSWLLDHKGCWTIMAIGLSRLMDIVAIVSRCTPYHGYWIVMTTRPSWLLDPYGYWTIMSIAWSMLLDHHDY